MNERLKARKIEEQGAERVLCGKDTMMLIKALRELITRLDVARASGSGERGKGPPDFGGLGLTCIEDLASWVMERALTQQYFGLFQDANSPLTSMRTDLARDGGTYVGRSWYGWRRCVQKGKLGFNK